MEELFSVTQFFKDGTHETVRQHVEAREACDAFRHYTNSVAVRMGFVTRVIITDALDMVSAEWVYGKGVVFPVLE